jgi:4-amino-4-deoxy-L-arabinose transferase-like glycosyltransferase
VEGVDGDEPIEAQNLATDRPAEGRDPAGCRDPAGPLEPAEGGALDEGGRFGRADWLGLALVILVVAAALRLHDLDRNPPEFFEDELSGAVSAWSIVTTGHDVERTTLPFLRTRLELKQPIYGFSVVPFWAILGHSPFNARLPAVVYGVIGVALLMLLVRVLGRGPPEAILAGAIAAVLPWAVHYGRVGWEPSALLPFSLAGIALLWVGLDTGRRLLIFASAIVLALGAYAYHPALLMHVVLAGLVVGVHGRGLGRRQFISLGMGAGIALLILVPYALALRDPLFTARTANISVFGDGVNAQALATAWNHYWIQWDPRYLFGSGAVNPRINPGAVLFWWMIPVFLVGVDELLHRRSRVDAFLLAWLVLGPLPAALTSDGTAPHFARGLLAMPPIVIISAIGTLRVVRIVSAWRFGEAWRAGIALAIAGLALVQAVTFYEDYFGTYSIRSANWWGYGSGAALRLVRDRVPPGGTVCIATNDISGFTFPHQLTYWVGQPPFTVVQGVSDGRCQQPGTYILAFLKRDLQRPVTPVAAVADAHGGPLFQLSLVDTR